MTKRERLLCKGVENLFCHSCGHRSHQSSLIFIFYHFSTSYVTHIGYVLSTLVAFRSWMLRATNAPADTRISMSQNKTKNKNKIAKRACLHFWCREAQTFIVSRSFLSTFIGLLPTLDRIRCMWYSKR